MTFEYLIFLMFEKHWLLTTLVAPQLSFLWACYNSNGLWAAGSALVYLAVGYVVDTSDENRLVNRIEQIVRREYRINR